MMIRCVANMGVAAIVVAFTTACGVSNKTVTAGPGKDASASGGSDTADGGNSGGILGAGGSASGGATGDGGSVASDGVGGSGDGASGGQTGAGGGQIGAGGGQTGASGGHTGASGAHTGAGGGQTGAGGGHTGAGGGSSGSCDVAKAKTLVTSVDSTLQTSDACAACLCANCATQTATIEGDTKAIALLACGKKNNCNGDCCFCGAVCNYTIGTNYRNGPCAAETEAAAGVPTPSSAIVNGSAVKAACVAPATPTSCSKPIDIAACIHTNCEASCGTVSACGP